MTEREAKLKAIENVLECLNEAPFKVDGAYFNRRSMAEAILAQVEQVEVEFDQVRMIKGEESRD